MLNLKYNQFSKILQSSKIKLVPFRKKSEIQKTKPIFKKSKSWRHKSTLKDNNYLHFCNNFRQKKVSISMNRPKYNG